MRTMVDPKKVETRNKKWMLQGKCEKCGAKIGKFISGK
jgi:hypothetical protein